LEKVFISDARDVLVFKNSFRKKEGIMSSIYNYGAYDLAVRGPGGIFEKWVVWEGPRKRTRPDRLSFWCWGGRGTSSKRSVLSSFAGGGFALKRRFGVRETKAGNRNGPFSTSVFGSELMLPPDSKAPHRLDVS
jgi:hypothetical protein